ncbi:MAG: hypothetical protein V1909_06660 [Candidatus Micrarchaeota archaeon]
MKIDVTKLNLNEVNEIAERLGRLNIHTCFSIMGGRAMLVAASAPVAQKEEIRMVAW